uniref:Uncharacterized protein n=1 Tax=Rhizophora mucronata TaxID=61149 RepID=A0A2P2QIW3_RHIMU
MTRTTKTLITFENVETPLLTRWAPYQRMRASEA